jgi:uncharacterized protein (DUF58 family)
MRAWQAITLVTIAGFLGLATGNRMIQMTLLVLLAMLGIGIIYRFLARADVQGAREISDPIVAWGSDFDQKIILTNTSRLAMPAVRVIDESTLPEHPSGYVTNLMPRRSITWDISVPCTTRGRYRLGPVQMFMSDPLGLFPVERTIGTTSSMLVLPRWVHLNRTALKLDGFLPGEAQGRRRGESPPNVTSVRDYVPGDSVAAIHWPASARTGKLATKLFAPEVQTNVWLALDLDGEMGQETEELLVTVTASLAMYGLQKANLRVGLVASGLFPITIPSERGRPHSYRLQEILAEVHCGTEGSLLDQVNTIDGRLGPGTVVVLVTSRTNDLWNGWLGHLMRHGVAARVIHIINQNDQVDTNWPISSVTLPSFLSDPIHERTLVSFLEGVSRR